MAKEKVKETPEQNEEQELNDIQAKIDKGEELTPEEEKALLSSGELETNIGSNVEEDEEEKEKAFEKEEDIEDIDEESGDKDEDDEETPAAEKEPQEKPGTETGEQDSDDADSKKEPEKEDDADISKINQELDKPDGQEDLEGLTKREKALYWEMKRDRRKRQQAEEERDTLKFKELKRKAQEEAEAGKKEEEEDPFEGKEDDDFLSVADAKKILAGKAKDKGADKNEQVNAALMHPFLRMADKEARERYSEDYDDVIECAPEIVDVNPSYLKEIADAVAKGENPAIKMYHLIKADPQFEKTLPVAQARLKAAGRGPKKEEKKQEKKEVSSKTKEAQEKFKKNQQKPKTSAHYSNGSEVNIDNMSIEDYAKMPDSEFAALPRHKRDAILKKFG